MSTRPFLNRALRILLTTNGFILFAGALIGPIAAIYVESIGGDILDAGIAGGLFALAAGFTTLFSGKLTDKVKEHELIVVAGYLLMGVGFLLYTVASTLWLLFAVQILIGFAEALYSPAFDKLFSEHAPRSRAGRAWGIWESMNYFTLAIGAFAGGVIVRYFGFTPLFLIMGMLCIGSALYIYFLPRKVL